MKTLLAFDPGGTTGWARFTIRANSTSWRLQGFGEFKTWTKLDELISHDMTILYERIRVPDTSFDPIGLEVIGVIKYLSSMWSDVELVQRVPAHCKGVQQWGIFDLSGCKSQHSKDAIAHGIAYLGRENVVVDTHRRNV